MNYSCVFVRSDFLAVRLTFMALIMVAMTGCRRGGGSTSATVAPVTSAETRTRWVYDQGWYAKGSGDAWFEHNDEALRIRGKAWEFRQTKSTTEYVELYDASRGVSLRLKNKTVEARWDMDGPGAEWKTLYTGHWDLKK